MAQAATADGSAGHLDGRTAAEIDAVAQSLAYVDLQVHRILQAGPLAGRIEHGAAAEDGRIGAWLPMSAKETPCDGKGGVAFRVAPRAP